MLPTERRRKIIEKLEEQEFLELKTLHKVLNISMETLRRDIQQLVKQQLVKKEYGGIRLHKVSNGESAIERRLDQHLTQKQCIANKALKLINDGDCIYLDSGSTTLQIAKGLEAKRDLTIITNSIPVLIQCMPYNHTLISIGGKVRSSEQSLTQFDFLFNFEHLNIHKGFFCCSGLTVQSGITDYSIEEVETRRRLMAISQERYLTADSSKINRVVTAKLGDMNDFHQWITDDGITQEEKEIFEQTGIKVI